MLVSARRCWRGKRCLPFMPILAAPDRIRAPDVFVDQRLPASGMLARIAIQFALLLNPT